jgi:hypothetical protein
MAGPVPAHHLPRYGPPQPGAGTMPRGRRPPASSQVTGIAGQNQYFDDRDALSVHVSGKSVTIMEFLFWPGL